jgi:hypothetical protein
VKLFQMLYEKDVISSNAYKLWRSKTKSEVVLRVTKPFFQGAKL